MACQRKSSKVIAEALERLADLKAIDPNLELGNNLNVAAYDTKITEVQTAFWMPTTGCLPRPMREAMISEHWKKNCADCPRRCLPG